MSNQTTQDPKDEPRSGSLDALVGHWLREEAKFRDSGHNSILDYDTRARFRAYADVYDRCRKELMEYMANAEVRDRP